MKKLFFAIALAAFTTSTKAQETSAATKAQDTSATVTDTQNTPGYCNGYI